MNSQACDWLCDTWTVIRKELRELVVAAAGNAVVRGLWAVLAVVFGVVLPWWMGHNWLDRPLTLVVWLILPVPLVVTGVAESIAGERERHTLEPLLATRLPIRAILTGKILAATVFGWLGSLVIMLIGLAVVNLADPAGALHLYTPGLGVAILWFGLLAALFTACVGVSVSMHATTVRRACITMSLLLVVLSFGIAVSVALMLHLGLTITPRPPINLPAVPTSATTGALLLLLADIGLFVLAGRQFRRTRLLTD